MKKSILFSLLVSIIIVSGCSSKEQERISELESDNYEYQREIDNLKSTIDDCNNNIADAKSYVGSDYEDMEYALDNLEDCTY